VSCQQGEVHLDRGDRLLDPVIIIKKVAVQLS
jgi:hypothetical protein